MHEISLSMPFAGAAGRISPRQLAKFDGKIIGQPGPATSSGIVVQRGRELLCLDPLTFETFGSEKNLKESCELFGDEQYLVIADALGFATVLRMQDGVEVGVTKIPQPERRVLGVGHRPLVVTGDNDLTLLDPLGEKPVWSRPLRSDSRLSLVNENELAILRSDGGFELIQLADGKQLFQQQLTLRGSLSTNPMETDLAVLRSETA